MNHSKWVQKIIYTLIFFYYNQLNPRYLQDKQIFLVKILFIKFYIHKQWSKYKCIYPMLMNTQITSFNVYILYLVKDKYSFGRQWRFSLCLAQSEPVLILYIYLYIKMCPAVCLIRWKTRSPGKRERKRSPSRSPVRKPSPVGGDSPPPPVVQSNTKTSEQPEEPDTSGTGLPETVIQEASSTGLM